MSETVIKFIILTGQNIRSRILQFRVGSDTCWFRKVRLVKFNREPAGMCFLSYSKRSEVLKLYSFHYREGERDMALFMCGR